MENISIKIEKEPKVPQKRGRKPKGGKTFTKNEKHTRESVTVILHLKRSLADIKEQCNDLNVD